MGIDGRTPYERRKPKAMQQVTAEFGAKVHYRVNLKGKAKGEKLESRWGEGISGERVGELGQRLWGARMGPGEQRR